MSKSFFLIILCLLAMVLLGGCNRYKSEFKGELARALEDQNKKCQSGIYSACEKLGFYYYRFYQTPSGEVNPKLELALELLKKSINGNSVDAYRSYASISEYFKNLEQAILYFDKACAANDYFSCRRLAYIEYKRLNFSRAFFLFDKACAQGRGDLTSCAPFVPRLKADDQFMEKKSFYSQGCSAGSGSDCYSLGMMLYDQSGDRLKAMQSLEIACNKNIFAACGMLGRLKLAVAPHAAELFMQKACSGKNFNFCRRLGVLEYRKKNYSKAVEFLNLACKQGGLGACVGPWKWDNVRLIPREQPYEQNRKQLAAYGILSQEEASSNTLIPELLSRKCSAGDPFICGILGGFHYLQKRINEASPLLKRACHEVDDYISCKFLGQIEYDQGNHVEAKRLFQKACSGRAFVACRNLARIEILEDGVTPNALRLLEQSCDNGLNKRACWDLGRIYRKKDIIRSALLYKRGCDGDFPMSCLELGNIYGENSDLTSDLPPHPDPYKKACKLGNAEACFQLGQLKAKSQNKHEELDLIKISCQNGNPRACLYLGKVKIKQKDFWAGIKFFGKGLEGEIKKLKEYFTKRHDLLRPI